MAGVLPGTPGASGSAQHKYDRSRTFSSGSENIKPQ